MPEQSNAETTRVVGTNQTEVLNGTSESDVIIGLAGDDQIDSAGGQDLIYGDFIGENLLSGTGAATSFAQYGDTGAWTVRDEGGGHTSMSQSIETVAGARYEISFELAANYGANALTGAVEVLWNGEVIAQLDTNSAVFEDQMVAFQGTGALGELSFRSVEPTGSDVPEIFTDQPVFYYETTRIIDGDEIAIKAIAEGQSHIYQVLNGKLHLFDPVSETYMPAGAEATVVVNAIGFNQEDNLIYGIAVKPGFDALGNPVAEADLVMYDAGGDAYRIGATPYRSWTADIDANGNLWAFHSSMDRVTRIDLDQQDADGNSVSVTYKFPKEMITDKIWDVGFDADTETFYGIVKPAAAGEAAKLFRIDISEVENGGEPVFSTTPIVGTLIDGEMKTGVPSMTFGAFVVDGDGNLYAGGNGGDHDMDSATKTAGGIYKVVFDSALEHTFLELVSGAPKASSNDGAVDPRTMDPFAEKDHYATVLIRAPEVVETPDAATSYDDQIHSGADADTVFGGYGADLIIGAGRGDVLQGGAEDDALYGGAGPDSISTLVSVYDADGTRYDPFGNVLPEDDDQLFGGEGDDFLSGSAGHDSLHGGVGNDTLEGGTGFDRLFGDAGDDALHGGSDQDTLHGGDGDDTLNGGSGHDTLHGDAGRDALIGGSGDDILSGGGGDDDLKGGPGADILYGDDGDDRVDGGADDDEVYGGAGADYVKGGSGHDLLSGGAGKDKLMGYTGNDLLDGGDGADRIYLGAGDDVATGGAGNDRFIFRDDDLDGGLDRITDFRNSDGEEDSLDLRALSLLSDEVGETAWIASFVSLEADASVIVDLGGCTITFDARETGPHDALYLELCDGILF